MSATNTQITFFYINVASQCLIIYVPVTDTYVMSYLLSHRKNYLTLFKYGETTPVHTCMSVAVSLTYQVTEHIQKNRLDLPLVSFIFREAR